MLKLQEKSAQEKVRDKYDNLFQFALMQEKLKQLERVNEVKRNRLKELQKDIASVEGIQIGQIEFLMKSNRINQNNSSKRKKKVETESEDQKEPPTQSRPKSIVKTDSQFRSISKRDLSP